MAEKSPYRTEIKKLGLDLIQQGGWGRTYVGSHLLREIGEIVSRKELVEVVYRLANDSSWEIRETAAGLLKHLLLKDFDYYLGVMKKMVKDKNPNIRRAAVVGSMQTKLSDEQTEKVALFVYTPLITDENEYVRKNLGPFALDNFLRLHPPIAFKFFDRWVKSREPRAIWNVLNAFSISRLKSKKYGAWVKEAKNYLKIAESFDNKTVQTAVKSLRRRLEKIKA